MSKQINHIYKFGEFQLQTAERLLLREGRPISLTPKAFETLLVLVQRSGHVVEKDELMKRVWADAYVEEANLARNVWALRKALGDDKGEHSYIETIPKLGYRFLAPVTELPDEASGVLIQRRIRARIVSEEEEYRDGGGEIPLLPVPNTAALTVAEGVGSLELAGESRPRFDRKLWAALLTLALLLTAAIGFGAGLLSRRTAATDRLVGARLCLTKVFRISSTAIGRERTSLQMVRGGL